MEAQFPTGTQAERGREPRAQTNALTAAALALGGPQSQARQLGASKCHWERAADRTRRWEAIERNDDYYLPAENDDHDYAVLLCELRAESISRNRVATNVRRPLVAARKVATFSE